MFNLEDYAPVEERLAEWWAKYPDGRVFTEQVLFDIPTGNVEFRCELYTNAADVEPISTGWAHEVIGEGHVNQSSAVENCETSAIGRALANMGLHGSRHGKPAPRPSREEMSKVERVNAIIDRSGKKDHAARPLSYGSADAALLDEAVRFGKYKGSTWNELLESEPDYVDWCAKNVERMADDLRAALRSALAGEVEQRFSDEALDANDELPF